jgi:hypothetical protein
MQSLDLPQAVLSLCKDRGCDAQSIADQLLDQALQLDKGRANDDTTVLVLTIRERRREASAFLSGADVRRLSLTFPLPSVVGH